MRFFTYSLRSLTLGLFLVTVLVLSMCAPFAIHAQSPEPSPSPSASPTPTSSPTPTATPTPEPTPTGSPVPGIPYQGLLNMNVLKARPTPVVPQIRAAVPSTRCSRSQPDCVTTGQGQQGRLGQPKHKAEAAHGLKIAGGGRNRSLSPVLSDHETKAERAVNVFRPGSSFFAHLSLWDAQNGILAVRRNSFNYPTAANTVNSSANVARPAMPYGTPSYDDWVAAMLDPINRTGGTDPLSRNFHWGVGLLGLPGRAGLDAGLPLSYDSLIYTKDAAGDYIAFDLNKGFPSPGFHLGFSVIYGPHTSVAEGVDAYLMITPNGGRVELRQIDSTNVYEAADSSYLQMINNGDGTLLVRGTDGTRWSYTGTANGYRVTEIKDTNGNYITVTNSTAGRLQTMTDTLGRVFTVNYDTYNHPTSISQTRGGSQYTWVTFGYTTVTVDLDFTSLETVGISDNDTITVLNQVGRPTAPTTSSNTTSMPRWKRSAISRPTASARTTN